MFKSAKFRENQCFPSTNEFTYLCPQTWVRSTFWSDLNPQAIFLIHSSSINPPAPYPPYTPASTVLSISRTIFVPKFPHFPHRLLCNQIDLQPRHLSSSLRASLPSPTNPLGKRNWSFPLCHVRAWEIWMELPHIFPENLSASIMSFPLCLCDFKWNLKHRQILSSLMKIWFASFCFDFEIILPRIRIELKLFSPKTSCLEFVFYANFRVFL